MTALFRYAGSKQSICPAIFEIMLKRCPEPQRYLTPTLGSGADLYWALQNISSLTEYVAGDLNAAIVAAHEVTKTQPGELNYLLEYKQDQPEYAQRRHYEFLKNSQFATTPLAAASRALFLLGAGVNGIWRESKKSGYNVQFGKRFTFSSEKISNCSRILNLKPGTLLASDFAPLISQARAGDLIYIDPPFFSKHQVYQYKWPASEHARLYTAALAARQTGAYVFISNADCDDTRLLYPGIVHEIAVKRSASAKASSRGWIKELLVEV